MRNKKLAGYRPSSSTQKYLDIAEIRDNTVVLKDGTLRAVLMVSSINFSLKSEDEQKAIVSAYINFLNTLTEPLQIVIQSRQLNIDKYLDELKEIGKAQTNELLRMQTQEYYNFITELISLGKIMSKRFYVAVAYRPSGDAHQNFFKRFLSALSSAQVIVLREKNFQKYRSTLEKEVNVVMNGLSGIGLSIAELDTQGLIELFYKTYNPDSSRNQKLHDVRLLDVRA